MTFDVCAFVVASSNGSFSLHNTCVKDKLLVGIGTTALDSLGLIGPAGGVARIIGHQAGYVGVVADQYGSKIVGSASKGWSAASFSASAVGHTLFDTPEDAGSTVTLVTGLVPFLSQASAIYAIGIDIYKTAKAVNQCPQ